MYFGILELGSREMGWEEVREEGVGVGGEGVFGAFDFGSSLFKLPMMQTGRYEMIFRVSPISISSKSFTNRGSQQLCL